MPASAFALCAKILAKGTRGVDFTNVLREAFMQQDPKSAKKTDRLTVIIVLLGFARVKASSKVLVISEKSVARTEVHVLLRLQENRQKPKKDERARKGSS